MCIRDSSGDDEIAEGGKTSGDPRVYVDQAERLDAALPQILDNNVKCMKACSGDRVHAAGLPLQQPACKMPLVLPDRTAVEGGRKGIAAQASRIVLVIEFPELA